MLKLIMCVKRQSHLTREAFDHYWRNNHASLVARHAAVLGIRKYIQTVPSTEATAQMALQQTRRSLPASFDGCAELWWDDMASHLAARSTPAGLSALRELIDDESKFVDLGQSQLWYGEERCIIPES